MPAGAIFSWAHTATFFSFFDDFRFKICKDIVLFVVNPTLLLGFSLKHAVILEGEPWLIQPERIRINFDCPGYIDCTKAIASQLQIDTCNTKKRSQSHLRVLIRIIGLVDILIFIGGLIYKWM